MATQKYREDSRTLLAQGRAELAAGDVRQASGRGWGHRADPQGGRRTAWLGAREIPPPVPRGKPPQGGNRGPRRLPSVHGGRLPTRQFHEDELQPKDVAEALDDVERLLDKLKPLINP